MAKALAVFLLPIIISIMPVSVRAASVEDFYKGKTIQFVVGGTAGGGYDTYTRLIARHFPQFVPGKPSTIVQNMPGAAMLIAANYTYNSAPRDGTVIGHWSGPLILQHMMGNPAVQFEGRKFGWIGMPTADCAGVHHDRTQRHQNGRRLAQGQNTSQARRRTAPAPAAPTTPSCSPPPRISRCS